MAAEIVKPNDALPMAVGWMYRLGNADTGGNWVRIVAMDFYYVYAVGVDNHKARVVIPRWRFDDIVDDYIAEDNYG